MMKNIENSSLHQSPAHARTQNADERAVMAPWLKNIAFPKSREALLQAAEENTENGIENNEVIMARFRRIRDVVYNNVAEVRQALGDM